MCDVLIATGDVEHRTVDIDLPGYPPFEFWRQYTNSSRPEGAMGVRWRHSWERYLIVDEESFDVLEGIEDTKTYPIRSVEHRFQRGGDYVFISFKSGWSYEYFRDEFRDKLWRLGRQKDPRELWIEFHYSGGFLRSLFDAHGRDVAFRYSGGLLTQVEVKTGNAILVAHYSYNRNGQLIEAVDAAGKRETFEYEGQFLVSHLEKRGARRYFAYDSQGRCALNWYQGNKRLRHIQWSANADRAIVTDSYGAADVYRLEGGKPIALTDPLNRRTEWIYDLSGNLLCRMMCDGRPYLLSSWDPASNDLKSADLRGATTSYRFENDVLTQITNATGASLVFERNHFGDVVSLRGPERADWRFEYDVRGSLTKVIDPTGHWISREEALGQVRISDMYGLIGEYQWDDLGNLRSILEADTGRFVIDFLGQDRPIALWNPDGGVMRWEYDAQGRTAAVVDPLGRRNNYSYTQFGSTSEIGYPDRTNVRYVLDDEERLVTIFNTKGETTDIQYDLANRITTIRFFDGRVEHYGYDDLNRVVELRNHSSWRMRFTYDASTNPTFIKFPDGSCQENTFDELNRLTNMKRIAAPSVGLGDNSVIEFKFNLNGLIVGEKDARGPVEYTLDTRGKLLGIRDAHSFSTDFERDSRGRAISMRDPSGSYRFVFGLGNQLHRICLPNGAEQHFTYDEFLRQTRRILIGLKGEVCASREYRYDLCGQLVWMNDWLIGTRTYDYDVRGRLTAIRDGTGRAVEEYSYDSEGNILNGPACSNVNVSPGNRIVSASNETCSYDEDGRLIAIDSDSRTIALSYGAYGNVSRACVNGQISEYGYDLMGRRIEKRNSVDHQTFRYNGNRLVRITSHVSASLDFSYVPDTLVPIAQTSDCESFFYTFDQIGTPTEVWDRNCSLVAFLTATAYGALRVVNQESDRVVPIPFHFPGQFVDDETNLHYNRFRYYWPQHGRYIVHDPIGLSVGLNLYSYPRNPLTWIDPFGLNPLMLNCGYADGTSWDACEQYAAQMKLDNINSASVSRRKKTCTTCREDKQKSYFKKTCGGNPAAGNQVDHSLELQLGGADYCCGNLIAIPAGVNQSFGSQIKNLISGLVEGAAVPQFAFNSPGCAQANMCTDTASAVQRGTKSDGKDCANEPALNC